MHNHNRIAALAIIIVLATAAPAISQIVYGQPMSADLRVIYSHWSQKDESGTTTINQWVIPITGLVPLKDNLEMRFYAANASNSLDSGKSEYRLSGFSDVRLQINSSLANDRILLSAGFNLPTGKKELSRITERPVMAVLTENYLGFPIRGLGEGLGLNLLVGVATAVGNSRMGASVMYQYNGPYKAYEDEADYKPGDMLSIDAGGDTKAGELALEGGVTYTTYTTDKVDERKVFKQSDQLDLHVGGNYKTGSCRLLADVRYLIRGRNTRYDPDQVIDYRLKVYGNELAFAGGVTWTPQPAWYVTPLVELRFIDGNEFDDQRKIGPSNNLGVGIEGGRTIMDNIDFGVGFKYYTGSADDGNIDLSGYRLSAGLTAAF
jgi:hypothetical protein